MEHIAVAIEQSTGEPYGGCPWQAFDDPLVSDVVQAYPWWEKSQLSLFTGPHPPARFVEAFDVYQRAIQKLQNDEAEKAAKRDAKDAHTLKQRSVHRG